MEDLFGIEYSCYSPLADDDESKYISEVNGSIMVFDEDDNFLEVIGKFNFSILNLILASEDGFFIPAIFDYEDHLMTVGEGVYDFESNSFILQTEDDFDEEFLGDNLIIFRYMEIIPEFRGRNLAAMVFKDVINRFGQNCGLLAFRIFTLQHVQVETNSEDEKKWMEKLKLEELEKDEEQAFYKLAAYFQRLGFVNINDDDIFTLNLAKKNPLDDIKLQEME
jgi:hypothetical protein